MRKFGSPSSRKMGAGSSSSAYNPCCPRRRAPSRNATCRQAPRSHGEVLAAPVSAETPDFAPARDQSLVVEIHRMNKNAALAPEANRNHLAAFAEIAKAGRIRQTDEFKFDDWIGDFERLRHDGAQGIRIGQMFDHEIFARVETIRPRRIGGIVERHGESAGAHIGDFHLKAPSGGRKPGKRQVIMAQHDRFKTCLKRACRGRPPFHPPPRTKVCGPYRPKQAR